MATTRYIAKRVGDRYITVPVEDSETSSRWKMVGGIMLGMGMLRGGLLGKLKMIIGAGLIYRGITGRNPIDELLGSSGRSAPGDEGGPSYQHDFANKATQAPGDEVDEASMESFPASDPPAHSTQASAGA